MARLSARCNLDPIRYTFRMVQAGRFELHAVVTGRLRLDGGAMFGVVPKVLWSRVTEPDGYNRIDLATRTLLAVDRDAGRVVLVDTGCGAKWSAAAAERYAIQHDADALDRKLGALGFSRTDVTDVVITHLHFDHNGGLTDWVDKPGGETTPRYPRARHWVHRRHWQHALAPHIKDRASFLPQDFEVLDAFNLLAWVEGEAPAGPIEGWTWFVSHGHTPYQLHPIFAGKGGGVVFAGDLIPTRHHLALPWVMAFDVEPMRTIDEKLTLFRYAQEHRLGLVLPHDPDLSGFMLEGDPSKPRMGAALDL